ncbi:origin recognition complex subunit 6 isoform X2 [Lepidochelys kempii]|uniref:origin recognition complex subunit 6 isoform X2 n=1 Tax=Lepidochelys kempii TaxID=8472 RepID=UPI003C6F8C91
MEEPGVIQRLAPKLGIAAPGVLRKAEEYLRLSQVKCTGLLAQMTATSNAVMCLDLAAGYMQHPVDKSYLVKLSGLNKRTYQSCMKSFECLLGLNSNLGIRDLAVQFCCMEAVNTASKILQRCLKLKVDKKKMVDTSGVKKAIFDRLCSQLETIGQQISRDCASLTPQPTQSQKTLLECIEKEEEHEDEVETPRKRQKSETEAKQDYEEWKQRILENATKAKGANV